jgi:hypothetical protein
VSTTEVEVIISKLLNGMGVVAYGVQVSTLLLTSLYHFQRSWPTQRRYSTQKTSVADPDPYVFGPPGSGTI